MHTSHFLGSVRILFIRFSKHFLKMKVFIKVLQGDGCMVEVNENMKILEVKKQIETHLKVPVSQQILVIAGRTLSDDQTIGAYPKIKDGTKVHLVIKKPESLEEVLGGFLQKYYSEKQTELILEEFMKDFNHKVKTLSLDDLEKLAISYLNDENM
ncbi:hypothetical protein FQR65_LT00881 [Abscondita terminalis]|nr:hypothetical protein FQR65_LT00881 [Abscondita terminalis]